MALAIAACADDDTTDPASPDTTNTDAGSDATNTVPGDDAASDAGAKDSGADAQGTSDAGNDAETAENQCTDEGWCHTDVPDTQFLKDVWGDGQGSVWSVSVEGNIFRWDGKAWTLARAGTSPLYAVWGSGPTDVWVGGDAGLLHGTGASPSTLTWAEIPLDVPIRTIWGTSATDIWTGGYTQLTYRSWNGRLYHFAGGDPDVASSWVVDPTAPTTNGYDKIWGLSSTDFWIGGLKGIVATSDPYGAYASHHVPDGNGGYTWRQEYFASNLFLGGTSLSPTQTIILGFGPPETYVTGDSSDNGATFAWTSHDGFGVGVAHRAVWSSSPNDIYMASIGGWLRHFDGTSWNVSHIATQNVIPVINDFSAIWGTGPNDVWVVGQDIALHKGPVSSL